MFVKAQNVVESLRVGFKGERIPFRKPVEIRVGDPFHKLHVLAARLVQPRALAQGLELDGRRRGETLLLSKVADGHSLHGLVSLHQQLPNLLKDGGLHAQQVSVPLVGLVHTVLVVGLGLHGLQGCVLLELLSLVHLEKIKVIAIA